MAQRSDKLFYFDMGEHVRARTSRRTFLKRTAAGSLVVAAGCTAPDEQASVEDEAVPAFFKDTEPFLQHGTNNLESRLEHLGGYITPNALFFVRNNSNSIRVSPETYRLEVSGNAVRTPLSLSLDELMTLPQYSVHAYLECGGNLRSFFGTAMGQPAQGTQWGRGGVGMAVWTGVALRDVLERAGITDEAVDVLLIGLDTDSPEGGFRRAIPVAKAMDPDTLLAYRMNGEVLPPDHGFPLRALVPGWVGSSSIKWLGRIEVAAEKIWTRNTTTSYVLIGDTYEPEGEAKGQVATHQSIKSSLILPWPATLEAGMHRIRGYAYSPHAGIEQVLWQVDDESEWRKARLIDPPLKYAWSRFEIEWDAAPGTHTLTTKATDASGNTQPESIPHNQKGYLYNVPLVHPVRVA